MHGNLLQRSKHVESTGLSNITQEDSKPVLCSELKSSGSLFACCPKRAENPKDLDFGRLWHLPQKAAPQVNLIEISRT